MCRRGASGFSSPDTVLRTGACIDGGRGSGERIVGGEVMLGAQVAGGVSYEVTAVLVAMYSQHQLKNKLKQNWELKIGYPTSFVRDDICKVNAISSTAIGQSCPTNLGGGSMSLII